MTELDKKSLTERDICSKFITPAVKKAGWDELIYFTKGRIIVRGKLVTRGLAKFADYHRRNIRTLRADSWCQTAMRSLR